MKDEIGHLAKVIIKNCEPLYLSDPFIRDGHTEEKANGTITYVKYNNVIYGITCAHIYYQMENNKWLTVFSTNRVVYQFGHYDADGYVSHFRVLRKNPENTERPDIAIIRFDEPFLSMHLSGKGKKPIDLDGWIEPDWRSLKMAMACGFPTEHKTETDLRVSAKLVHVIAEVAGDISLTRPSFLLASTLSEENEFFFSGMSGGPVYCEAGNNRLLTLIGIIFEGQPGSSTEWRNRGESSFLTKCDIQIWAYIVTPSIFENWLKQLNYI